MYIKKAIQENANKFKTYKIENCHIEMKADFDHLETLADAALENAKAINAIAEATKKYSMTGIKIDSND